MKDDIDQESEEDFNDQKMNALDDPLIRFESKQLDEVLKCWWGGLVILGLLRPDLNNQIIGLVVIVAALAVLRGAVGLIYRRMWLDFIVGIALFAGLWYLIDHSWRHALDEAYSNNDES